MSVCECVRMSAALSRKLVKQYGFFMARVRFRNFFFVFSILLLIARRKIDFIGFSVFSNIHVSINRNLTAGRADKWIGAGLAGLLARMNAGDKKPSSRARRRRKWRKHLVYSTHLLLLLHFFSFFLSIFLLLCALEYSELLWWSGIFLLRYYRKFEFRIAWDKCEIEVFTNPRFIVVQ